MNHYIMHLIDPVAKTTETQRWRAKQRDFRPNYKRALGTDHLVHAPLMPVGDVTLYVVAIDAVDKEMPGFQIKGSTVKTAGRALLIGVGQNGGVVGTGVGANWMKENVEWLTAEECADEPESTPIGMADAAEAEAANDGE